MFNYNDQINDYHLNKVRIGEDTQKTLRKHREANQNRLKRNIPEGITINDSDFVKQGSYANKTMTQHKDNDYDIDDGVIFKKEELVGDKGGEMSPLDVRKMVEEALHEGKFEKKPERKVNCVRVFYKEGHHVDVPSYRKYTDTSGSEVLEIAGSEWRKSDPRKINRWFEGEATGFNNAREGRGLQLRVMIRLLKRFCRSRDSWSMPSGIILTMLTTKEFPDYERDDECFYFLLKNLQVRLGSNLSVYNEADNDSLQEELTKSGEDSCMTLLRDKVDEALDKLAVLHGDECTLADARKAWDWVFKTDGHFEEYDEKKATKDTVNEAKASRFSLASIPRFLNVSWRKDPLWTVNELFTVSLVGKWGISQHGINWNRFESNSAPLDKHRHLRFRATTTAQPPYRVWWQVVNTGSQAINAGGTRGDIIAAGSEGAGGLSSTTAKYLHKESTLYSGSHSIECFIVKNSVCVARSGPFIVNIK